jgi:hypothetical protein
MLGDEFVLPHHLLFGILTDRTSGAHIAVSRALEPSRQRPEDLLTEHVFSGELPTGESARRMGFRTLAGAGYALPTYPAPPGMHDVEELLHDAQPGSWRPAGMLAIIGIILGTSLGALGDAQTFVHGPGYLGAVLSDHRFSNGAVGPIVTRVVPGSPANSAGVLRGDIILEIDRHLTLNSAQVAVSVRRHDPGDRAVVRIARGGKPWSLRSSSDAAWISRLDIAHP